MSLILIFLLTLVVVFLTIFLFGGKIGLKNVFLLYKQAIFLKFNIITFYIICISIGITVINWFFQHELVTLSSYILVLLGDAGIERFMNAVRGIYDYNSYQNPILYPYPIIEFLIRPMVHILGYSLLFVAINFLTVVYNKKIKNPNLRLKMPFVVALYYLAITLQVFTTIFFYSQTNIAFGNAIILLIKSLNSILIATVVLIFINKKLIRDAFEESEFNPIERAVFNKNNVALYFFAVVFINAILISPNFFAIQFISNTFLRVILLLLVAGIVVYFAGLLFKHSLKPAIQAKNILSINLFPHQILPKFKNVYLLILFLVLIAFIITAVYFQSGLFTLLLYGSVLGLIFFSILITALIGVGYILYRKINFKGHIRILSIFKQPVYLALLPFVALIVLNFCFYTIKPLGFDTYDNFMNKAYLYDDGSLLYFKADMTVANAAVELNHIPQNFLKYLTLQEDKHFANRHAHFPSMTQVNGFNFRFLGSNLTQQLSKNIAFPNSDYPKSLMRKVSEMPSSYMLGSQSDDQLTKYYSSIAGFGNGKNYRGAYLASYHLFNRSIYELNDLELIFLINTTRFGSDFKLYDGTPYSLSKNDLLLHTRSIKKDMIAKATVYNKNQEISNSELRRLKSQRLRFDVQETPIKTSNISTGTRLWLDSQLKDDKKNKYTVTTTLKADCQKAIHTADSLFKNRFANQFNKGDYTLYNAALVIDIKTGSVIAHYGGDQVLQDINQYPFEVASLIKPLILAEAYDLGLNPNSNLYDGPIKGRYQPKNFSGYSYKFISQKSALIRSKNIPFINMEEHINTTAVYRNLNTKMLRILNRDFSGTEIHDSYPLGFIELSIWDIAQLYQALFNNGRLKELSFNFNDSLLGEESLFKQQSAQRVKSHLSATIEYGTTKHLKTLLPKSNYFSKTGSAMTNKGWTVLANENILIVSVATYGDQKSNTPYKNVPKLPGNSGARNAGYFAAYIMSEIIKAE